MKRGAFNISMRGESEDILAFASRILRYDPDTGKFVWAETRNGRALAGGVAGSLNADGYIAILVDGKQVLAHRLAMYVAHGETSSLEVDHRNGVRDDNRVKNLRWADDFVNSQNIRRPTARNTTGILGVCRSGSRFRAVIKARGKAYSLGSFATAHEAGVAYANAKREMHAGAGDA